MFTPGRMSSENRQIIIDAINDLPGSATNEEILRLAYQLLVAAPEFHVTNIVRPTSVDRPQPAALEPATEPYKAIVYFMLAGGADTYNLLVPHTCSPDMYSQYAAIRKNISLPRDSLHQISATGQVCSTFGLHPRLEILKELYDDGDAAFFANTGVLFEYSTKDDYIIKNPTQLFAHNKMQQETKFVDVHREVAGTGVLGRMIGRLNQQGFTVNGISLANQADVVVGEAGVAPAAISLNYRGVESFDPRPSVADMPQNIEDLNKLTNITSSLYGESWSDVFINAIAENNRIKEALDVSSSELAGNWTPATSIESQLAMVARLIRAHDSIYREAERDVFYVELGGWDTHDDVLERFDARIDIVAQAIEAFSQELKIQGNFDKVTTVVASEFARTLTPNSGQGSDHAWGGNYFMFGGDVNGGRVHGTYPDDLSETGPLGLGTGRLLPTSSWDHPFFGITQWFGLTTEEDMDYVLPNWRSFPQADLFSAAEMFN
uniref:DUF1501 domain-containing protein n=1 Tax=Paramoeba aestuarina TaxID=180227 RepID=A0A7S4JHS0_9EUKA|mmetsp:Transcript_10298/g.15481  ORF Transcript_10298/g.15481 Transcript_10298/m.15481 type:complete len:491 (+) Transcript_10298:827-2299(+)